MLLKKFKTISGIHGLDSFEWLGSDLSKFSLLYGWNGSGKTTMSNVLYCLRHKQMIIADFEDTTFKVESLPAATITQNELKSHSLNLAVFNQEYIDTNVHFDNSGAEPIVMIGEANIDLLEEIKNEQIIFDEKAESLAQKELEAKKLPDCDAILSKSAQQWRAIASELSVSGDKYFGSGFNISNVRTLIKNGDLTKENLDSIVITAEDETNRKQAVKKEWEAIAAGEFEDVDLQAIYDEANKLLKTTVSVTKLPDIEALNHVLQQWVEQGVSLHAERDTCAFCKNPLNEERLNDLKSQFTDALSEANGNIDSLLQQISEINLAAFSVDSNTLMPTLREKFAEHKETLETPVKTVSEELDKIAKNLRDKKLHLTDSAKTYPVYDYPAKSITLLNKTAKQIATIVESHNTLVENSDKEVAGHLQVLLLNSVALHLKTENYFAKVADVKDKLETIKTLRGQVASDRAELDAKKSSLNDQKVAVEKINGLLSNFFDNNKLCFKPIVQDGVTTYEIRRYGKKAKNLSEGEKSVLALAHFLVSLKGSKNSDLSKTVVVIDDPVDSQDSNFLFRTYGVIRRCLKDANQIVILTHNFDFFNIIRDWFASVSENPSFLLISREAVDSNKEKMKVENLPTLLKDYKTEYHYLFYKLFGYCHMSQELDAPLVANIARKVLEYFSSFKWCCRNSEEFAARIQSRFLKDDATPEERAIGDAVYKFVNEYSHAQDPFRPIGIAEQEAKEIAKNTLKFIELADEDHYNSLKKQCNREAQK